MKRSDKRAAAAPMPERNTHSRRYEYTSCRRCVTSFRLTLFSFSLRLCRLLAIAASAAAFAAHRSTPATTRTEGFCGESNRRPVLSSIHAAFREGVSSGAVRNEVLSRHDDASSLRRRYEGYGGIVYRQSVLSSEEFRTVRRELASLMGRGGSMPLRDEKTSSVAKNRVGAQLPRNSAVAAVLGDEGGSMSKLFNRAANDQNDGRRKLVLSKEIPIEVRVYERTGAGMDWHVDDILFSPEQVEVIFTVENTSDCVTKWEGKGGRGDDVRGYDPVEV